MPEFPYKVCPTCVGFKQSVAFGQRLQHCALTTTARILRDIDCPGYNASERRVFENFQRDNDAAPVLKLPLNVVPSRTVSETVRTPVTPPHIPSTTPLLVFGEKPRSERTATPLTKYRRQKRQEEKDGK